MVKHIHHTGGEIQKEMCHLAFLVRMAHAKTCATGAKITLAKNAWVSLWAVIDASSATNCILSNMTNISCAPRKSLSRNPRPWTSANLAAFKKRSGGFLRASPLLLSSRLALRQMSPCRALDCAQIRKRNGRPDKIRYFARVGELPTGLCCDAHKFKLKLNHSLNSKVRFRSGMPKNTTEPLFWVGDSNTLCIFFRYEVMIFWILCLLGSSFFLMYYAEKIFWRISYSLSIFSWRPWRPLKTFLDKVFSRVLVWLCVCPWCPWRPWRFL